MVDKQIRIDITSRDDASDALDDVADAVEKLEAADPEVVVDADTADADRKLDTVDELVDALDRRAAEIDVAADTSSAESGLADVEGQADDLARLDPEIVVDADVSEALDGIDDVKNEADQLTDADREIVLKAKISDAKGELKSLRDGLDDTARKAEDTKAELDNIGSTGGPRLAGNAMSDLTGPLGDASGAAGDFGGVLDGVSDIAETMGTKLGLSEAAIGSLTGALGAAGFAVAGIAAGITYFTGKADAAREKQEELTAATHDYQEALEKGEYDAAADQLVSMYEDVYDAAKQAGLPIQEVTDYITGTSDALPTLSARLEETNAGLGGLGHELITTKDKLDAARGSFKTTSGILADQKTRTDAVAEALGKTTRKTDDLAESQDEATESTERLDEALGKLKDQLSFERTLVRFSQDFREAFRKVRDGKKLTADDILGLKENVLDVAEFAKMTPAEVRALLRKIDQGKIREVRDEVQTYMDNHTVQTPAGVKYSGGADQAQRDAQNAINQEGPVEIDTQYKINWDSYYRATHPTNPNPGSAQSTMVGAAAGVTNVTVHLPRGYRERDVIAASRRAARHSGGLYRRVRR